MNTIQDRVREFIIAISSNASQFEKKCGLSNGAVSKMGDNTRQSVIDKIVNAYPEINRVWLRTGVGDMFKAEEDNQTRLIPFYDVETTGGFNDVVGASDGEGRIVGHIDAGGWFNGKETAAIRHTGDSMVEYPSGCILAVREVMDRNLLVPGKNYVIETDEYRLTKRVQRGSMPDRIALYSTNEATYADGRLIHEPFEVKFENIRKIFSVLGYVVNEFGEIRIIK